MTKTIIFTDLDGSLLHPKTYSFAEAMPALELIKKRDIPLILCSSKTRAELEVYRERLDNRHPFIVENGGGIFIPEGYFPFPVDGDIKGDYRVIILGTAYKEIREKFVKLRERMNVRVRGFGDMSAEEIAALAGLPLPEANLAKQREFDEPFIFQKNDAPQEAFLKAIEDCGLHWTQGRFFHVLGDNDKGRAIRIIKSLYEKEHDKLITAGLGDSLNDLPLLKEVDHPVLVRKEDGSHDPRVALPRLEKTAGIGPVGWNEAIMKLLHQIC